MTNHSASVRDLYVEEVSAEDANLYLDGDAWRSFDVEEQAIPVRDAAADVLVIRRSRRGPVINEFVPAVGDGEQPVLSMRWIGSETTTGFEAMLGLMRSKNVAQVLDALAKWPMPIFEFCVCRFRWKAWISRGWACANAQGRGFWIPPGK